MGPPYQPRREWVRRINHAEWGPPGYLGRAAGQMTRYGAEVVPARPATGVVYPAWSGLPGRLCRIGPGEPGAPAGTAATPTAPGAGPVAGAAAGMGTRR